jgi:diguanylate cyclase (GGDEF)-like protein
MPDHAMVVDAADVSACLAEVWHMSCTGQIAEALAMAYRLHAETTQRGCPVARAGCSLHIAQCCFQLGYMVDGLDHAQAAIQLYHELGDVTGEARARATYAFMLIQRGDSELALDEALRALDLGRASADPVALSTALNAVGVVYALVKQPEKALPFLEESVAIARRAQDAVHEGRWLCNLGLAQYFVGLQAKQRDDLSSYRHWADIGVESSRQSLALAQRNGDTWSERILLCNLAETVAQLGDYESAEAYLATHDQIPGTLADRALSQYQFTRGVVLAGTGQLDEAITFFELSLATAGDADVEQAIFSAEHLATACEAAGRHQEALAAYKTYHALYVRIAEEAVQRRARIAAVGFETDKLRAEATNLASANLDLQRETQRLMRSAMEDSLTQLPNRRRLESALFETLVSGERYTIAMLDVDHFKQINDRFSHVIGDEVLREVADIIRRHCRPSDLPARYGGEEFSVLMRGADHTEAAQVCERLRRAIAEHDWQSRFNIQCVTVSIGAACWDEAESPSSVLAIADKRLYQAKAQGRNRVVHEAGIG